MSEKTQVDQQVGAAVFAVNLVSRPPRHVRDRMIMLQDSIAATLPPDVTHRTPEKSLHISIFQFAWAREKNASRKQSAWQMCQEEVLAQLQSTVSSAPPLLLKAAKLEVRSAAIIVVFSPSPELEALRDRINDIPFVSSLASRRPRLQHVTLFRYSREVALDELKVACEDAELDLPVWHVASADLVREAVYPSLAVESLRSFELSGASACGDSNEEKRKGKRHFATRLMRNVKR